MKKNVMFAFAALFLVSCGSKIIEQYEKSSPNGDIRIRIRSYKKVDIYPLMAGQKYSFEAYDTKSEKWSTIFELSHDDPVKIPVNNFHFIDNDVAIFYFGWLYAVTIDAGKQWYVWDANKDTS